MPFLTELNSQFSPAQTIDAIGLNCPLPLLKLKQALSQVRAGACIYLITSDVNSPKDIVRFCEKSGHRLQYQAEHQSSKGGELVASCHLIVAKSE